MNDTPFAAENAALLPFFCTMPPAELQKLSEYYGFLLTTDDLMYCRKFYRAHPYLTPTVGQLRFFDEALRCFLRSPEGCRIGALADADEDNADAFRDICAKRATQGAKEPPSLNDLFGACGAALERGGITASEPLFYVGQSALLASACNGVAPRLALDTGTVAAILSAHAPARSANANMLFLLMPTAEENFPTQVAKFLAAFYPYGLAPIAQVGDEGLLLHLLKNRSGLDVDFSLLPGFDTERGVLSLCDAGKGGLLFFAPARAIPHLQATQNANLVLFGSSNSTGRLTLRQGAATFLNLPTSFFNGFFHQPVLTLSPFAEKQASEEKVSIAENDTHILAGVTADGGTVDGMLSAVCELVRHGMDPATTEMTCTLEMPANDRDFRATAKALPLIFAYHRVAAELTIPATRHRLIQNDALSAPRLTAFLLAKKASRDRVTDLEMVENAAVTGDFGALRHALYEKI